MLPTLLVALLTLQPQPTPPAPAPASTSPSLQPGPMYSVVGHVKLTLNLLAIKFFTAPEHKDLLLRYLEASPSWRVGIEGGPQGDRIVVYHRNGAGRIELNGFVIDPSVPNSGRSTRIGFVFAADPVDRPGAAPCMTTAAPDAGDIDVSICSYKLMASKRSASLFAGAPGAWLALSLSDQEGKFVGMDAMLKGVEDEFAPLAKIAEAGDPAKIIDAASTKTGEPSITIDDTDPQGLQIDAWVNPGEPGVTSVRMKRAADGAYLTISHAHLYARERVGFSSDPRRVFFADSVIIPNETATGWNTKHDLVFEMWFKPDAGGPERKLIDKRQTIAGYEN